MSPNFLSNKIIIVLAVIVGASLCGQAQQPDPAAAAEIVPLRMTAVEDASAPSGWKRYQFGNPTLFSALLPGAPQYQSKKFPAGQGSLSAHLYIIPSSTGVLGLNYIESSATAAPGNSETESRRFFNGYMKGFIESLKEGLKNKGVTDLETEVSVERRIKVSGHDGYEQDFSIGPFNGRSQVVFLGRNVYSAIAFWNKQSASNESGVFFKSFQIRSGR
jgi:hypothetical protein